MRQLRSAQVIVPTLARGGLGTQTALDHRRRKRREPDVRLSFPDHWNREDVRGMLYAVHGRSCVYCGCHLPRNDRGDVDHFRPKGKVEEDRRHGGYWWLAYAVRNVLLSCSLCNRSCKRSRFPLQDDTTRVSFTDRRSLELETRLLLDPVRDPVDDWLEVLWRNDLCPLRPHSGLGPRERARVETTLELFRINHDPRLIRERRDIRDQTLRALNEGREEEAWLLAVRYHPYSFVARAVLTATRGHLVPTPRQELDWLLRELTKELLLVLSLLEQEPHNRFIRREAQELAWALAVLWKDPPAGDPNDIREFLAQEQLEPYVRSKLNELGLKK